MVGQAICGGDRGGGSRGGTPDGSRVRHAHPPCQPARPAAEAAGSYAHARRRGLLPFFNFISRRLALHKPTAVGARTHRNNVPHALSRPPG
jgi:hypothetical protein